MDYDDPYWVVWFPIIINQRLVFVIAHMATAVNLFLADIETIAQRCETDMNFEDP